MFSQSAGSPDPPVIAQLEIAAPAAEEQPLTEPEKEQSVAQAETMEASSPCIGQQVEPASVDEKDGESIIVEYRPTDCEVFEHRGEELLESSESDAAPLEHVDVELTSYTPSEAQL